MTTELALTERRGDSQTLSNANKQTLTHSPPSLDEMERALQTLCCMKSQAQFTPLQLATWAAVLSQYPIETVNLAVLHLGLCTDPFPDLSKVLARCEYIEHENNPQPRRGEQAAGPSRKLIHNSAKALGLKIEREAEAL